MPYLNGDDFVKIAFRVMRSCGDVRSVLAVYGAAAARSSTGVAGRAVGVRSGGGVDRIVRRTAGSDEEAAARLVVG